MGTGLRDHRVWQEAVAIAAEVVRALRQHNRRETKAVADHVMLSALALAETIAEGYSRYDSTEQRQRYRAARELLWRLETQVAVLGGADLIPVATATALTDRLHAVARPLTGYLVYLDRQASDAEGGSAA